MPRKKKPQETEESTTYFNKRVFNTPISEESRENQMIELAMDLVEYRLRNGTASSQETTHFLKLGSLKARQDYELGERQKDYLDAKTSMIHKAESDGELYSRAMAAMRTYKGMSDDEYTLE